MNIIKKINRKFGRLLHKFNALNFTNVSYSQCGEDLIVRYIFNILGIVRPSYIDIGAHDPFILSNTAIFYFQGSTGINIEPDPTLFNAIKKHRKKDINLNCGIHPNTKLGEMDFYFMSAPSLNTFSETEAQESVKHGYNITKIKKIEVISLDYLISNYCNNVFPDFLSLDVEGLDLDILKAINYDKCSPKVICVESVHFKGDKSFGEKDNDINVFLQANGYKLYADTFINSIFIREDLFSNC